MRQARTARILTAALPRETVTKVTNPIPVLVALAFLTLPGVAATQAGTPAAIPGSAAGALYQQLGSVGLDSGRVFHIRDASIEHEDLHITFDDGTIAFTKDVLGKVTGAYFEGEGDLLLMPPGRAERASLGLFTGTAILEEKFISAYLRFNDNTYQELQPALTSASDGRAFFAEHDATAQALAAADALRLLITLARSLPVASPTQPPAPYAGDDHFLHARLASVQRGVFDVFYDSLAREQVSAGQLTPKPEGSYYDLWTSFAVTRPSNPAAAKTRLEGAPDPLDIRRYRIRARVTLPHELSAKTFVDIEVRRSGERALLFELSRFLQVRKVQADGRPVDFVHNPALEGTQLARGGNDVVAVVFPQPLRAGEHLQLSFEYSGPVLSEAGGGLLYVGARGTWYPNRGVAMSEFDLQFRYPSGWMLVATGKRVPPERDSFTSGGSGSSGTDQVARWISERPMPMAGFNLGQYVKTEAKVGNVLVDTYAATGVEHNFPQPPPSLIANPAPEAIPLPPVRRPPIPVTPPPPSPARNAQAVADQTAHAIDFLSQRLGPFPYGSLALTQMPGKNSQGWPGLIFLSSFAFLTPEQRQALRFSPEGNVLYGELVPVHETAHQWWGDLVSWGSYRDQWIGEALANYCALMMLEREHPPDFAVMMEAYRQQLLDKNKAGLELREAGPVTLGLRLSSSKFPDAYDAIAYGRGTWLVHMLRYMLRDATSRGPAAVRGANPDELFLRTLRALQQRYAGRAMTLRDLQQAFEENLPRALWYENRKSLEWFFDSWVNGTAIPRLHLSSVKFLRRGNLTVATGKILQQDAPADLVTSVPIYAVTSGGQPLLLGRVFGDGPETPFRVHAPAGTRKLLLDPYQTVLSRIR